MSEKVKRKKKLDEIKTKAISLVSSQENKGLTVETKNLHSEIKSSRTKSFKADPEFLKKLTGTEDESLGLDILVRGYMKPLCELQGKQTLAIPFMQEMKPQNALEAMLCSQILSLHCVGMDSMRKSENETFQKDSHLNNAIKLFRVQHETVESLMKLRRNGEQKLIVQHVNVCDGGQAVVNGQLTTGGK